MRWLLVVGMVGACAEERTPTQFEVSVRLGEVLSDREPVIIDRADLEVEALRLTSCDGEKRWIRGFGAAERPRQLVSTFVASGGLTPWNPDTRDRSFLVPTAPWCDVEVILAGPLHVFGHALRNDASFSLTLLLPDLGFYDTEKVGVVERTKRADGTLSRAKAVPVVLELAFGGWLDPIMETLASGGDVAVEPGDALHDDLVAAILADPPATASLEVPRGPALYRAADADVSLTLKDRAGGLLGWGEGLATGPGLE